MRIVLFTDTYPPEINGVATSTYNLRKTLVNHGHDVMVVATNPYSNKILYDEDNVIRVPGLEMKWLYGYKFAGFYNKTVMKDITRFKPDVIHIQTDSGNGQFGFTAGRKLRVPTIYTYHTMYEDYAYYVTKGHFDRFARSAVRFYVRMQSRRATEFIAPSIKIKDYMRNIGSDSMVNVVPTGIEFGKFAMRASDKADVAQLKAELGIKPDEYVILSLGRIAKEKSIDICIRGYANYLKKGESVPTKLLIVGGGPALDELKALAKELQIEEKVVFAGAVDPSVTQRYYHLGDAFVSASISETQGLTFMEAMASGLVVMARYDDNLLGTITDNKTGFFFLGEEDFPAKLEKVIGLSQGARKAIIMAANKANEPYSLERFYENIIEVYKRAWKKKW